MIQLPFDITLMNGRGVPSNFHIRRATPEDLDHVMELQQTIVDALPNKDVYATYTREESLDALETDYCYIAFAENGDVAGYSVLIANTTPDPNKNYGHHFDYDEEHMARTASLDHELGDCRPPRTVWRQRPLPAQEEILIPEMPVHSQIVAELLRNFATALSSPTCSRSCSQFLR
jgi:hypothetical protein